MKITNKTIDDLGLFGFERAKKEFDAGHRYLSWYGFNENGEIVDYKDETFKYPAIYKCYPKNWENENRSV